MLLKKRLKRSLFLKILLIFFCFITIWLNFSALSAIIFTLEPLYNQTSEIFDFSKLTFVIGKLIIVFGFIVSSIILLGKNKTQTFFFCFLIIFISLKITLFVLDKKDDIINSDFIASYQVQDSTSLEQDSIVSQPTNNIDTNYVAFTPPQSYDINNTNSIDYEAVGFISGYILKFFNILLKIQLTLYCILSSILGLVLFLRFIKKDNRKDYNIIED